MAAIYSNLTAYLSDEISPDNLTMQNVTQDTTFGAFAWSGWGGGTNVNEQTASGVCLFTWARTLKPRVQIRKYYGVFTEEGLTDGTWVSAVRNACNSAMVDHIQSFEGSEGLVMLGVAYNRTLLTTTDALSTDTAEEPGYQRRRRRGRGS
ncbi:MAG: hypothetical protein KAV00_18585, partial [Phycisphaerae bacterium]|nr:hypothetical protein [Phycisphaerae bacterium]